MLCSNHDGGLEEKLYYNTSTTGKNRPIGSEDAGAKGTVLITCGAKY
jgi:hypothetical protein